MGRTRDKRFEWVGTVEMRPIGKKRPETECKEMDMEYGMDVSPATSPNPIPSPSVRITSVFLTYDTK